MIKDTNYITIPGWMVNKLNLKGTSLIIYALIYGFCQDESSCYKGSLQYLQEWSNATRQGVSGTLKKLIQDKLIIKTESFPYNEYRINKDIVNKFYIECKQSLHTNINNNINNINNNITEEDNKYKQNLETQNIIDEVINYLNKICGTHFKSTSGSAKKCIKARIKEGYKLQDFKDVIDFKYKEWGLKPKQFSNGQMSDTYLRPSTLFANGHFDEYLQAAWTDMLRSGNIPEAISTDKLEERSDLAF